jgi:hypothetical protein
MTPAPSLGRNAAEPAGKSEMVRKKPRWLTWPALEFFCPPTELMTDEHFGQS